MQKHAKPMTKKVNIPVEMIGSCIYLIRCRKVMRDTELAKLYGVETFNLNKAVRRNRHRFPEDFMFQITHEEAEALTFQIGMSKPPSRGGRRTLPYVFTEQGVAMLSTVLNSERAIKVNIAIMLRHPGKGVSALFVAIGISGKINMLDFAYRYDARGIGKRQTRHGT